MTKYLPPYSLLSRVVFYNSETDTYQLPAPVLKGLIKLLAQGGVVDEDWYELAYSDVASAIFSGSILDALSHFAESGYFEGRRPRNLSVDEDWYVAQYSDVRSAIESGKISSAHAHFNTTGYFEGRASNAREAEVVDFWRSVTAPDDQTGGEHRS